MRCTRAARSVIVILGVCLWALGAPLHAHVGVIKSPNDRARYESFTLPNQLEVLLVSDPETDKSAASLAVHVGSGSDPDERQGLAHFLEHMLFLGTQKYPRAGEYQDYVRAHGGGNNAYTSFEFTNYFFDIDPDFLAPALDRFAQFFIAPRFTPKYVQREMHAVESEYRLKLKSDGRRGSAAMKAVMNPAHPMRKFQGGNLETLGAPGSRPIREQLIAFYEQHYSANIMALVVLGKEPLPVLKGWVTEKFSDVRNRDARPLAITEPLFEPGRLPLRLDIVPTKDTRLLQFMFPTPAVRALYRRKPTYVIGDILGYEGKGSLLSLLKTLGWVDSLSAGSGISNAHEATFNVSMGLTREGMKHIADIGDYLFQYIRLMREQGIARWMFDEQKQLTEIDFRFLQRDEAMDHVTALATNLHLFPAAEVIRGPLALKTFDPALVRLFLGYLRPDNLLLTVTARGLQTDATAKWFHTPYKVSPIAREWIDRWDHGERDERLTLRAPNPFIPHDLDTRTVREAGTVPVLIEDRARLRLWHRQDETFGTPRSSFFFSVRSALANDTPAHAMRTRMYVDLVNDQLNEFSYPASLAGLDYSLYPHLRGLSVRISGFTEEQPALLTRIVETLRHPRIDAERFAILKERRLRALRNVKHDRPYSRAMSELTRLLLDPSWTEAERIAALEPLSAGDLRAFIPRLLAGVGVTALSHGDVYRGEALALARIVDASLLDGSEPAPVADGQVVRLSAGDRYLRDLEVEHDDSAIVAYFQGPDKNMATRGRFALLSQVLSSPFYNDLRTEQQLGYIVFSTLSTLLEVPGLSFVVQSPTSDPGTLETRTQAFIERFAATLAGLSEAQFERQREAVLTRILETDKTLVDRSARYWREIDRRHFRFDTRERLAQAVRGIGKDEFAAFYARILSNAGTKRITVRAIGQKYKDALAGGARDDERERIGEPGAFKRGKTYFPRTDPGTGDHTLPEAA